MLKRIIHRVMLLTVFLAVWVFHQLAFGEAFIYENGVLTGLGTLGGSNGSVPNAINNLGQVAGYGWIPDDSSDGHAFLWTKEGGMTGIVNLNVGSVASGINDNGMVVGYYWQKGTTNYTGFVWSKTNGMVDIGVQPNALNNQNFVRDVNNLGQVVGDSYGGGAYIWTKADGYKTLPGNWPETTTGATAINDNGIVTGSTSIFGDRHAYIWSETSGIIDLGTLNGFSFSLATDININGWVVGYSYNSGGENRAFLWTEEDGMIDLGTLGGTNSYASGINDLGQVVGTSDGRAFLWTKTSGMIDLGISAGTALDINNLGQIVGLGIFSLPPPTNLRATQVENDGTQIILTWDYGSDQIDGFKIERKTPSGKWAELPFHPSATDRTYSDTVPVAYDTYIYRTRAYKGDIPSDYSNEATSQGCQVNRGDVTIFPGGPYSLDGSPTTQYAAFVPTDGNGHPVGLTDAANACGFTGFNWQQLITYVPVPSYLFPVDPSGPPAISPANLYTDGSLQAGLQANGSTPPPFFDPPQGGGYMYELPVNGHSDDAYPFYWSASDFYRNVTACNNLIPIKTSDTLYFQDCPNTVRGTVKKFQTSLVGVCGVGATAPVCSGLPAGDASPPLFTWTWESTFDGEAITGNGHGGVIQTKSIFPIDPSSGTGGVTITSINGVPLPDTTPPVIAPQITETPGNDGWYRSNVTVNWNVTDDESGIYSSTGCGSTTVTAETAGVTRTCFATNGVGVSALVSITIKIDKTPPQATANVSPKPNSKGWNNGGVTVSFTGTDSLSGIDSCTSPITISSEGAKQVASGTCTDKAGNVSAPATKLVSIDKTSPVISGLPASGTTLWPHDHKMLKVATITASDALSGLASFDVTATSNEWSEHEHKQPEIVIVGHGLEPRTVFLKEGDLGREHGHGQIYTITAIATDRAGNKTTVQSKVSVPHDERDRKSHFESSHEKR